jgi:hypothetical protein
MNVTVIDTTAPEKLPPAMRYFGAVMPYRDGLYRWPTAQARRFHSAGKAVYPITVTGAEPHIAQIADCESGDLTPAGAAAWARKRNELHRDATVYVDLDNVPGLVAALGAEPCWLWVAWWQLDHTLRIPQLELPAHIRLAAMQYASLPAYDLSEIVSPEWPAHPFTNFADW